MRITLVKKILADGSPCAKCADVEQRLQQAGHWARIDEVLIADERDPDSAGMLLAAVHQVARAPFFLVENEGQIRIYTVYFKFLKEVIGVAASPREEVREILRDNPDLDFI